VQSHAATDAVTPPAAHLPGVGHDMLGGAGFGQSNQRQLRPPWTVSHVVGDAPRWTQLPLGRTSPPSIRRDSSACNLRVPDASRRQRPDRDGLPQIATVCNTLHTFANVIWTGVHSGDPRIGSHVAGDPATIAAAALATRVAPDLNVKATRPRATCAILTRLRRHSRLSAEFTRPTISCRSAMIEMS
jgi:hypothetical protein